MGFSRHSHKHVPLSSAHSVFVLLSEVLVADLLLLSAQMPSRAIQRVVTLTELPVAHSLVQGGEGLESVQEGAHGAAATQHQHSARTAATPPQGFLQTVTPTGASGQHEALDASGQHAAMEASDGMEASGQHAAMEIAAATPEVSPSMIVSDVWLFVEVSF